LLPLTVAAQRFWVPSELMFDFVKAVAAREVSMVEASGFLGMSVRSEEAQVVTVRRRARDLMCAYRCHVYLSLARRTRHPGTAPLSEHTCGCAQVATWWDAPTAFEKWGRSPDARRHHYPSGTYQFRPRKGEVGSVEDYLPFKSDE
jgi:hypothetical protein